MKTTDVQRVWHMKKYCEQIAAAIVRFGSTYDFFKTDHDYQNTLAMSIMQIGEMSSRLSDDFKEANNHIEWHAIKGMRNLFAHEYLSMDKPTVWETATSDIPKLLAFIDEIIENNKEAFTPPTA